MKYSLNSILYVYKIWFFLKLKVKAASALIPPHFFSFWAEMVFRTISLFGRVPLYYLPASIPGSIIKPGPFHQVNSDSTSMSTLTSGLMIQYQNDKNDFLTHCFIGQHKTTCTFKLNVIISHDSPQLTSAPLSIFSNDS